MLRLTLSTTVKFLPHAGHQSTLDTKQHLRVNSRKAFNDLDNKVRITTFFLLIQSASNASDFAKGIYKAELIDFISSSRWFHCH